MTTATLPARADVPAADTWDLSRLFAGPADWDAAYAEWLTLIDGYARFRGRLGDSAESLAECLDFDTACDRLGDRVQTYAMLRESEDTADGAAQAMRAKALTAASKAAQAASYIRPEILAITEDRMAGFLRSPALAAHKLALERLLRYRPHTLSESEEKLLAMQLEMAQAARQAFGQLTNADMTFGDIEVEPGFRIPLTHATFLTCLESPDRNVRRQAFHQYYAEYAGHANTLAATLAGSVHGDVYYAKARNYGGARAMALFPDRVPEAVYDNLVAAVRAHLPAVHRYFQLRRRALGLADIHHYDTYVPIVGDMTVHRTWDQAVELVIEGLRPLGDEYRDALAGGLRGRWCDRYENRGKRSGAFSSGCYDSDPYILMNYRPDVLDHVYTLAHEAGHSMHSWHSNRAQPYQYAGYTIFVAEVASTVNEQLLTRHVLAHAASDRERAYYLNREIDSVRATIVRQTMFAEFETITHALAERGEPLTLDAFKAEYRKLLDAYFGREFTLDDELSLECLRIPHLYRAFYVYKYATGMAAAITLAEGIANGGKAELDAYLRFLSGGSSEDPLDLLRDAGVDLETPQPVGRALERFGALVDELDRLLTASESP
ncbi:MAG TPA: oligoendopeptidase F [Gemmataceae bacterium]|jgi:oligoendopeptidase F